MSSQLSIACWLASFGIPRRRNKLAEKRHGKRSSRLCSQPCRSALRRGFAPRRVSPRNFNEEMPPCEPNTGCREPAHRWIELIIRESEGGRSPKIALSGLRKSGWIFDILDDANSNLPTTRILVTLDSFEVTENKSVPQPALKLKIHHRSNFEAASRPVRNSPIRFSELGCFESHRSAWKRIANRERVPLFSRSFLQFSVFGFAAESGQP